MNENRNTMTDIEAYQKLLSIFISAVPIDYKGVCLKIAQLHPVEVVEAIENPAPLHTSTVSTDNDENYILDFWARSTNVIQTIKDLRAFRHDRGRKMGIDTVTQEGLEQCRGGLKVCKDDVEAVLIKHELWTKPIFRG